METSDFILNAFKGLPYKVVKVLNSEIQNIKSDLNNLNKTKNYKKIASVIEQNNNQLENLDKIADYNKILNQESNLKNNISLLKQQDFKWDSIIQQAEDPEKHIPPKKTIYTSIVVFFGFFALLIFIFLQLIKLF